jgi:hypothetical protein
MTEQRARLILVSIIAAVSTVGLGVFFGLLARAAG